MQWSTAGSTSNGRIGFYDSSGIGDGPYVYVISDKTVDSGNPAHQLFKNIRWSDRISYGTPVFVLVVAESDPNVYKVLPLATYSDSSGYATGELGYRTGDANFSYPMLERGTIANNTFVRVSILPQSQFMPSGGTTGQALAKSSASDFAVAWTTLVPTGGTTGQALVKSSSTNFATSWGNISGIDKHPIPKSATSYWGIPGVWSGAAYATKTLAANILYYQPFIVSGTSAITVSAVGLNVSTLAAATSIRIGIYAADNNLQPTTLMVDAGTVSSATTGWKTVTGLSTSLTPGPYLFAYVSNGGPAVSSLTGNSWFGYQFDPTLPTNWLRDFRVSFTYGTLPTPTGTAWNTVQNNSGGSYENPCRMLWS